MGLERTGLLGMFLFVNCSSLAVVSIFLPGSPFLIYGIKLTLDYLNHIILIVFPLY